MAKILYAEDHAETAKDCIELLKKHGHTVYHACDGVQALELYRQHMPDLVLLDVLMPRMSGMEVAKIIREDDRLMPILILSSLGETFDLVTGLGSGANDYIRKEVVGEELIARIEATLRYIGFRKRGEEIIDLDDECYLDVDNRLFMVKGNRIQLSPIEVKVMKVLCVNKNYYVSKDVLVRAGWGNTFKESYRYLDKLMVSLRKSLPERGPVSIATSWGKGLGLMVKKKRK